MTSKSRVVDWFAPPVAVREKEKEPLGDDPLTDDEPDLLLNVEGGPKPYSDAKVRLVPLCPNSTEDRGDDTVDPQRAGSKPQKEELPSNESAKSAKSAQIAKSESRRRWQSDDDYDSAADDGEFLPFDEEAAKRIPDRDIPDDPDDPENSCASWVASEEPREGSERSSSRREADEDEGEFLAFPDD